MILYNTLRIHMKLYHLFVLSTAFFHMFLCRGMYQNDLSHMLKVPHEKLTFPEPGRQELVTFCNAQLYEKHVKRFNTESCQLLHQIKDRQKTNVALKAQGAGLIEEITK